MKIVCSNCGARHWLSDMQLSNGGCNVVCPRCSTTQYVDASMVDPQSLEPCWYYAVNDDTVGPLSIRDLEFGFQNGQLTLESYVWREGLSDWTALGAVPEFDYLSSPVVGQPTGEEESTRVASVGGVSAGAAGGYAAFGAGEETAAIDLDKLQGGFSPFDDNAAAGGIMGMDGKAAKDDEPAFQAIEPQANPANDMVGARSENSVLFSLSSLQAVSAVPDSASS